MSQNSNNSTFPVEFPHFFSTNNSPFQNEYLKAKQTLYYAKAVLNLQKEVYESAQNGYVEFSAEFIDSLLFTSCIGLGFLSNLSNILDRIEMEVNRNEKH